MAGPVLHALFAAAQAHVDLYLVAFGQEFCELFELYAEVVLCGAGADLHVLQTAAFLGEPFFFLALGLFVPEFVIAHEARHWGFGVRGNFNEVNAFRGLDQSKRLFPRKDAKILSCFVYNAEFGGGYLAVDPWFKYGSGECWFWKTWFDPFIVRKRGGASTL